MRVPKKLTAASALGRSADSAGNEREFTEMIAHPTHFRAFAFIRGPSKSTRPRCLRSEATSRENRLLDLHRFGWWAGLRSRLS
jgi:hypothetical protein